MVLELKKGGIMSIKKELQQIIKNSLEKNNIDFDSNTIVIETPKDSNFGDYSTNIALILAKTLKRNPLEIAEDIKNGIDSDTIEKIEIVKPGFINIFLSKQTLFKEVNKINKFSKKYGKSEVGQNKRVTLSELIDQQLIGELSRKIIRFFFHLLRIPMPFRQTL